MKKSDIIMRRSPKFLLGADPEFILFDKDGNFVPAQRVFTRSTSIKLGCDGHPDTGEMRPDAFAKPNKLVNEIEGILHELGRVAVERKLSARAGSGETTRQHRDPTGGHIHYSNEVQPTANLLIACNRLFTLPLNTVSKTNNRHTYLLPQYLISELATDSESEEQEFVSRAKNNRVWDRCHAHAGFEYRIVLSWLCHPTIARGTLTLAKIIGKVQIVFGDAELKLLNAETILGYANKFESRHIARFYEHIAILKRTRHYLEEYDIVKTWRVGKHGREAKTMYDVLFGSDDGVRHFRNLNLKCVRPIKIIGASSHRCEPNAKQVFLPSDSTIALPSEIRWCKVVRMTDYHEVNSSESRIGLSAALRDDNETCIKVIKAIVAYINRPRPTSIASEVN